EGNGGDHAPDRRGVVVLDLVPDAAQAEGLDGRLLGRRHPDDAPHQRDLKLLWHRPPPVRLRRASGAAPRTWTAGAGADGTRPWSPSARCADCWCRGSWSGCPAPPPPPGPAA